MKTIPNNTGWEVGEHLFFNLPDNFTMSAIIEYTHYYEDEDGRLSISPPSKPHRVIINCAVVRSVKDADGVVYKMIVPDSDRQFDEQSEFWRYCAECKLVISQEREEIDEKFIYEQEKEIINSFKA
jgi:hypothetical protein